MIPSDVDFKIICEANMTLKAYGTAIEKERRKRFLLSKKNLS